MTLELTKFVLKDGVLHWVKIFSAVVVIGVIASILFTYITQGPKGPKRIFSLFVNGFWDLASISLKRIAAITSLTIKEVVRKKTLTVFVIFAVLFMFGGWFLTGTSDIRDDLQVKNYISFTLTTISWLVLPVALLMSCWGIPEDIKVRSLHTVVTKPARRLEIVIGRILGYSLVGTVVLVLMGVIGNIWIHRQVTENAQKYLISKVPKYGTMTFYDREGNIGEGTNVGDVWEYRRYIEGATRSAAVWDFDNVTPDLMTDDALKLETHFEAFRTHTGEMKEGLLCQITLLNRVTNERVKLPVFHVKEFTQNIVRITRKLNYYNEEDKAYKEVDLFDDIVFDDPDTPDADNTMRVVVQCIDPGQYLGMARPDMFIRLPDKAFESGYSKAVVGIWLMMIIIISMGVAASCFLKGPVATLLTFSLLLVGQGGFREFLSKFVGNELLGGGPVESIIRIVTHNNQVRELEAGTTKIIAEQIDKWFYDFLWLAHQIIPDFSTFSMSPYIVNGFDVAWDTAMAPSIAITVAYVIPCIIIGYVSLKSRELESK